MSPNRTNPGAAGGIIERILPDERSRRSALLFLAGGIQYAHSLRPDRWGVTLKDGLVRLNVGRIETLAINQDWVHVIFHKDYRPSGLDDGNGSSWSPRGRTIYSTVPGSCGFDILAELFPAVRARLGASHRKLIALAANTSINGETRSAHSPGVLRYLEEVLDTVLPDPAYWHPSAVPDVDEASISGREGRRLWKEHFRRERNRYLAAQKKDLARNRPGGLKCEACGVDYTSLYRRHGDGFCEVHHRVPLAELEGQGETRLDQLAILCANCHRVIHRIKPMPTVEDFRAMLQARGVG